MALATAVADNFARWMDWLGYLFVGVLLGLFAALGQSAGLWAKCITQLHVVCLWLNATVGPVWVPMSLLAFRVAVLTARALSTRSGRSTARGSGSRELEHLAPLFTGLGFAGTVWGMWAGFGSLGVGGGELLGQLPVLLQGIGAAMVSTLVGLGLWAVTLSIVVWVPSYSWAHVGWRDNTFHVSLEGRDLGSGDTGLAALIEAVRGRQPEALCLAFERGVPAERRSMVATAVWGQRDADLAYREVTL